VFCQKTPDLYVKTNLWKLWGYLKTIAALLLIQALLITIGHAQITLDGTLGPAGALQGPNYTITEKMGRQLGVNLFHSFGQFNVHTHESATFTGPPTVGNIIGRVTGGNASLIDGRLSSAIQGANLYLINPHGMMFGPNARLDITGSFHASTADYIRLEDGGRFDATQPGNSLLTMAPPSAFGFLSEHPAPISVHESFLEVVEGKTLSLLGGNVKLQNGTLRAPSGRVNIASTASAGEVTLHASGLKVEGFQRLGTIELAHFSNKNVEVNGNVIGNIDASGKGAGKVFIRGGRFTLDGGTVFSDTYGENSGGNIDIYVDEDLTLSNLSEIRADTFGAGNSGDVSLQAKRLTLKDDSLISTTSWNTGHGGNLAVNAAESISVSGAGSGIVANVKSSGNGGTISISTPSMTMKEGDIQASTTGNGNAGAISLQVGRLTLENGAQISTSSLNPEGGGQLIKGDAGQLTVVASEPVSLFGAENTNEGTIPIPSGLFSNTTTGGNAGRISLWAPSLTLANGAQIAAASSGIGRGGQLNIHVSDSLSISGMDDTLPFPTGLFSITEGEGDAGNILLDVGRLFLMGNAQINTSTVGTGLGGNVSVHAREAVSLFGGEEFLPALISVSLGEGSGGTISVSTPSLIMDKGGLILTQSHGSGDAGDISLEVGNLALTRGAQVSTSSGTTSTGDGGELTVLARENVSISGTLDGDKPSGFLSDTLGTGRGGDLLVTATRIHLRNGGKISAKSQGTGNAGSIIIAVADLLRSENASITTSATQAAGGNITMTGKHIQLTRNSEVTASVRFGEGGGGNVNINAVTLVALENSDITARADQGFGGNIFINAQAVFFSDDSDLDASSNIEGKEGTVEVSSPLLDLTPTLVRLPESFLKADLLLLRRCLERHLEEVSRFIIKGRDGVPPRPDSLLR
jgi:filamentous hemagglutinin family protein